MFPSLRLARLRDDIAIEEIVYKQPFCTFVAKVGLLKINIRNVIIITEATTGMQSLLLVEVNDED